MVPIILSEFEDFLGSLVLFPELSRVKSLEMDLYGALNPSGLLDRLFFESRHWMGFEEFFDRYLQQNAEQIKCRFGFKNAGDFVEGLRARLYRTQFGFLTEYHAYLLCCSFFGAENVNRSVALDKAGVDFQICVDNTLYNIHIFVDSPRAWEFRRIKSQQKSVDKIPGIHVNLPYSRDANRINSVRYLPNGFGIYARDYLEYLNKEIKSERLKKFPVIGTSSSGFIYQN